MDGKTERRKLLRGETKWSKEREQRSLQNTQGNQGNTPGNQDDSPGGRGGPRGGLEELPVSTPTTSLTSDPTN